MTPFKRAYVPEEQIQKAVKDVLLMYDKQPAVIAEQLGIKDGPITTSQIMFKAEQLIRHHNSLTEQWRNDVYQVAVYRHDPAPDGFPRMIHLSIKRIDKAPIHDWRDLQQIKNELVGPEHEGVELYPAESRKADSANQYHIWVLADKIQFPFGFQGRFVFDNIEGTSSVQRPL